jgi:hypothetical protein
MNLYITRRAGIMFAVCAAATPLGRAPRAAGAAPTGKVILTVSGRITVTNSGNVELFDRAMLEALGTTGFETMTPWYNEPVRFDGVPMERLMQAVGATGTSVTAVALDDYSTDIPISDFRSYGVILAMKRNGVYMPVRDKGPLFIVYPYDSKPELKHQRFYSRSAWQVSKLIVK